MATLSQLIKFSDFCGLLRRLKKCSQSSERKREFEKFFKQHKNDVSFQNEELLPFLRIILSSMDSERRFDVKYKKLSQRVGKLLSVPAAKLVSFDTMSSHRAIEKLASEVVSRMKKLNGDLSVAEVNERLDRMADREMRDPDDADFEYLFQHCGEEELVWIFNVIIRNVESYIGASSSNLLSMLDDDAKQRWTLCRSLSAVVEDISSTDSILGRNFRPMLLARLPRLTDWWQPIAAHSGKEFFVELKYDGEHVLLHKINKDSYKYYTRNGKDFSSDYGTNSREGSISNRIHSFFVDSCVDCVLDVELVLYDKMKKEICRHNTAASDGQSYSFRYVRPEIHTNVTIAVVLFDILHYNGRSLLNVPLEERIKVLEKGVLKKQADDTIYIAKRQIMSSRSEVEEYFSESMRNDEEGIVVKSMTSLYLPGSRAKANGWFKLKPNLASSCSIDLAVVAILPHEGQNNRDAYLIAARDENSTKMVIVGSVSVGLSDLDRKRIYEDATRSGPLTADPHETVRGRRIEGGKGGFIHPHHMNVVEVTCTGVRGRKLVDPVIRCIREKPIDEIDSVDQFEELAEVLRQCKLPDEEEAARMEEKEERKRKKGGEGKKEEKADKERGEEGKETSPLEGKTVCVLQGVDSKMRESAFRILDRFEARNVANPVDGTDLVVAVTRTHPRTRSVVSKNEWTVVDVKWLMRCEEEGGVVPWNDDELIHAVPGTFSIE
ncbi:hypothetical protein PFISCL1PPCAC_10091 [Pristionchus fissidentatus]|uniref:DNA ligase IV n=1 Tax=Pristionchus fissidentatus TaxID=1538716 RepID=A0AAV5VK58_9BILA|nr:hypothetical protein PFISCL1PPCAC_10091 [Pristionchus fissidentatus]